jgi:serine phosphatase RsbU (regulator of sigma subunit)
MIRFSILRFPLLRTLPGKLFVLSSIPLVVLLVVREFVALPAVVEGFRKILSLAFLVSVVAIAVSLVRHQRHRMLWRVRHKLLVSYLLLGFVPLTLILGVVLFGSIVLYTDISAYVFQTGMSSIQDAAHRSAEIVAQEIGSGPAATKLALDREYARRVFQYPEISMAVVPVARRPGGASTTIIAGPWRSAEVPLFVPSWIVTARDYRGFVAMTHANTDAVPGTLIARAAAPTPDGNSFVVVDLPIDQKVLADVHARTGMRIGALSPTAPAGGATAAFRRTVVSIPYSDWTSQAARTVFVELAAPLGELYSRLAAAQSGQTSVTAGADPWVTFLTLLLAIGILFLVIQGSALIVGGFFARQITSAVHDLFAGTEHIQQGNFAHRIPVRTRDQLGELAEEFNRMSAGLEQSRHVLREKQRLDDELRIARDIQQSLLPVHAPAVAGIDLAAICEPAREVGGDYYDFFELGARQLGVLMADVSGKGTSAALYMAELKGLMLSLTRSVRSPRQLLIEANRLLAAHLDNRSFITMTYAIIDLDAGTLTCARAGHTPLVVVSKGTSHVLAPEGMVVGLRLPGASERFEELLEEHTRPIGAGDVIVLYTDGITEAMNAQGDLYGDAALAEAIGGQACARAADLRDRVIADVRRFVGGADQHDDMTMVVVKLAEA